MKIKNLMALAVTLVAATAAPAFAHTGLHTGMGFMAGFSHPFLGLDHLLAMVAVGVWAGTMGGRAQWLVPTSFVAAMAVGGVLGMQGLSLPVAEVVILLSVVVLGALALLNPTLPLAASMVIAATFAVFHGYAHGTEMPADASGVQYAVGFMLASIMLHGVGLAARAAYRRLRLAA